MSRSLATLALACLVGSCANASPAGQASATAAVAPTSSATAAATPSAAPDASRSVDVTVEVQAPLHARIEPSLGGAAKPSLGVVVTNRTAQRVDVSKLRVHLEAAREGVAFRCAKEVGPQIGDREPSSLAPGESFVFDRHLDCALPLVGAYSVKVAVSFGEGPFKTAREVRAFTLTVTALPKVEPREIAGLPGLWASMGSSSKIAGIAGKEGAGRTLLTIVNSTRKPIELPRMRLALRVYRVGNPIPCEDKPLALSTPAVLGPGEAYNEPIEISCLGLSVVGTYDIVARLVVPRGSEGDREVALGRMRVDVVTDPTLAVPPAYWWNR